MISNDFSKIISHRADLTIRHITVDLKTEVATLVLIRLNVH